MLLGARHSSGAFFCASTRTRHWSAAPPAMSDKLKLTALDADDLGVISTAVQDALVAVRDCVHFKDERRFVLLLNRFRWRPTRPSTRPIGAPIPPLFSTK